MENIQEDLTGNTIMGYHINEKIGSGGFGTVYKVSKTNESGKYIYALKHITIPTESQYNDVLSSMGGDYIQADNYFKSVLNDILYEINILRSLSEKNSSHVVTYYDNDIIKQENPLRYDIYIRMEYLTPLTTYLRCNEMKVKDVIKLGTDILSALELAHSNKIIHRDIKDDNIFINKDENFKLGDFGIAKILKDTSKAASMKGTPAFIAPEVYSGKEKYSSAIDLYSLGIVLYKLMNYSRLPFLPSYPQNYSMDDVDLAIGYRFMGKIPDLPTNAHKELGEVIVKAILAKDNRYNNAKEFSDALNILTTKLTHDELERVINRHITEIKFPTNQNVNITCNSKKGLNNIETTAGIDFSVNVSGNKILSNKNTTTCDDIKNKELFESVVINRKALPQESHSEKKPFRNADNKSEDNGPHWDKTKLNGFQCCEKREKIEQEHVRPVEKKDLIWLIYISPIVIGLLGAILFFTVVSNIVGKVSLDSLLAGDINNVISSINSSISFGSLLFLVIIFFILFVALIISLFFVGKQLQKKKESNSPGAVLHGREAYFNILEISQYMDEAKRKINSSEANKVFDKIKKIEEQFRIETDFGSGNYRVTECENKIAKELEQAGKLIRTVSDGDQFRSYLKNIDQIMVSLSSLLKFRREITKK